jgi:hypothetical protein
MFCIRLLPFLLVSFVSVSAYAQDQAQTLSFAGHQWRITARSAVIETHLGREALALSRGRVRLDDIEFGDGVIEFDVAYPEMAGFIGPMWRASDDRHFEEIYFRSHLNNKPDAVQYTPVENGNSAWQIFSDENAIASIAQKFGAWNHVRLVVEGDKADFYFNSDAPALHIPDLKSSNTIGGIGLRVTGPEELTAYFSKFTFRPLRDGEGVVGEAKPTPPLPEGLISRWHVSSVFPESDVSETLKLRKDVASDLDWSPLDVETNGIANISKIRTRLPDSDSTVFIRMNINAKKKIMKDFRFGYSDRVRIYLNGKRVYAGDAGWTVRDYRFLGTVGFFDSVGLDLKKGDNELMIAVSETFGGWAWASAIEDQAGIEIEN